MRPFKQHGLAGHLPYRAGAFGGPIMPLSQTLLMRIFPQEKHAQAMGLWAMTTVIGPILGPILGGTISDNISRHWIFFIRAC